MYKTDGSTYIKITDLKALNNRLTVNLDFSENISRYFTTNCFLAEYDKNIESVDKSILSIPPLSTVITVAWATGADIYVEYLDKTYLNSLNKVESVFKTWFPQFLFSTKIHVGNIVSNKFNNEEYALLFSGGIDSLCSYIRNKEKKPTLISIWGADIPTYEYDFWNKIKGRLVDFAKREKVDIHFIKTNARELINNGLIGKEYGEIEGGWWETVSHGLVLTGITAPLQEFKFLFIASAFDNEYKNPHGSHFFNFVNAGWADTKIVYDSSDLTRQEKIKFILRGNPQYHAYLKVCHSQFRDYNCGTCEKCLRTITGLVLEDIDPTNCSFHIKNGVFNLIKGYFSRHLFNLERNQILFWQDIQNNIPNNIDDDKMYNSKEFFEWFKGFDLSSYEYKGNNKLSQLLGIYYLTKYKGISYTAKRVSKYILRRLRLMKRG